MAFKFPKIKKLPRLVGCHLRDNKYAQYQSAFYLFFCLKLRWNSPNVKLRTLNCWTDIETFDYKQLRRTQHVPGDNTLVRPLWRVIWWRLPKFLVFILQIYLHKQIKFCVWRSSLQLCKIENNPDNNNKLVKNDTIMYDALYKRISNRHWKGWYYVVIFTVQEFVVK